MDDNGRLLRWAPWLTVAVLLASSALAVWAYLRDHGHQQAIEHDRSLIVTTERLLSALKDVETSERGFIITGRDGYLGPYVSGLAAVPPDEARATALIGPEADTLSRLVADRLKEAAEGIATYRQEGAAAGAARIDSGRGKDLMDQARTEVARLQRDADERIAATAVEQRRDDLLRAGSVIGFIASCVVLGLVAVLRRRQQQASQRLFEGVMENAPMGLGILDPSLRIRHVNQALSKMSERALSAVPGMSIWDVIPEMRDTLEARLQRVLQGGRAASAEVEAASNTRADQLRSYQVNFYPLQAHRGATEGVGMVIADVTARKRAERATRQSEERFRSLVEANAAMIWTTDAEGAFVKPQPAWMRFTGQSETDSLGWGRFVCVHPDDRERTAEAWRIGKAKGEPVTLENRLRRADGEWRHMAVSIVPVLEDDGSIREWVGSHTDITERKVAELALAAAKDAAEAANRAKSSFLANMSHELRTPLSAVIGYTEMLEDEAEDMGEQAMLTDLGKIKTNAKHLLGLINDVLDLSKVEAEKMDVFAEDIEVATFAREAAGTVEALVHRKSNEMVLDVADDIGAMRSDAVKLRQCLFNLLSNAAKFTENGKVTLGVAREAAAGGDWIVFTVRDTGIGMTAEQVSRLFQRFAQADETTTRKFGGTGLGLALSRAFARLLGGDVTVESAEGQGTCFSLRVPAVLPERKLEPDVKATLEGLHGTGELVLVIDDEASQRDLMTRFLQRQGFTVRTASEGRTGLELAKSMLPHIVLLDVMMPGMDGWSVLRALKADPATSAIPVIMVSFVADPGLSVTLGAADAVPKPVDWTKLKSVLDQYREAGGDVLVVDDDGDVRQRLRTVLEKNGWTVQEAGNGAEALERVAQAPPHLILLDLTMPVMDGFAFLHRLREIPAHADIPVIVLSARDISAAEREQLAEADQVFKKGETSMRDLTAEIRKLDGRHTDSANETARTEGGQKIS
ncbi:response regulator [Lichenifustis flavocetrariae]|uniref:histidine kinase n=1 Tax=Lichenifustis flavocetrariae TaxID=2949735 RepID=A0AA41Z1F7_9HYPH|nr:response regulator [Lichenifustis flavocetrariae]MCW6512449.1 response regulator [Lichenifustis flavocetrariae]